MRPQHQAEHRQRKVGPRRREPAPTLGVQKHRQQEPRKEQAAEVLAQHAGSRHQAQRHAGPGAAPAALLPARQQQRRSPGPERQQLAVGVELARQVGVGEAPEQQQRAPRSKSPELEPPPEHPDPRQPHEHVGIREQPVVEIVLRKHPEPQSHDPAEKGRVLVRAPAQRLRPRIVLEHVVVAVQVGVAQPRGERPDNARTVQPAQNPARRRRSKGVHGGVRAAAWRLQEMQGTPARLARRQETEGE